MSNGQELCTLRGHTGAVWDVAFGSEGRRLFSAGNDGTLKMWDATMRQEGDSLFGHSDYVGSVALSPDGHHFASFASSQGKKVRVWDTRTRKLLHTFAVPGESQVKVLRLAFSPDGWHLAAATSEQRVELWDIDTGEAVPVPLRHRGRILELAFGSEDRGLHIVAGLPEVTIWDARTGRELLTLPERADQVTCLVFSPDGRRLALANREGTITVRDAQTGQQLRGLHGVRTEVTAMTFSQDGRSLALGGREGTLTIWDLDSAREMVRLHGHTQQITSLVFSPNGKRLVSAGRDLTVKLWDTASGHLALALRGHAQRILSVAFSPDGERLFSTDWGGTLRVWNAQAQDPAARTALLQGDQAVRTAWHGDQAQECEKARHWIAVVFHLSRLIDAEPRQALLFSRRGYARAQLSQFDAAAADFAQAVALGDNRTGVWHAHALLRLTAGDERGYREACTKMLERCSRTEDPNGMAWVCTLLPDALPDMTPVVKLAEEALAKGPRKRTYLNTLGATLYRSGRYDAALQQLDEALQATKGKASPYDWLFLAMAHQRLGHTDQARCCLAKAVQRLGELEQATKTEGAAASVSLQWFQELELRQLRREAEATVNGVEP
jgi:WD40 repeat protein/Flp pilus assembly protein TadD